jgi:predicted site-specific integrase-resolvase
MMLKTKEAAAYLGMQETTLEAWRCRGGGPAFIKMCKAVRYRQEDLDAFISSNTKVNTGKSKK